MVRDARFVHDLLTEGAGDSLSGPQRRLLHARAAQALIDQGAEPALVAHHLEGAGRSSEALAWRLDAAERALEQGSLLEARRWLEQVLEGAPEDSPNAARAAVLLGRVLLGADVEAAHAAFGRARASAGRAVSPAFEARALTGLAQTEALRGHDAEARLHDQTASELAGVLPAPERARILLDLSEVRWSIGDFSESEERIAEAVRLDPSQPRYRLTLARHHWHRGRYEDAIEELMAVLQTDPSSARVKRVLHELGQNYRALGLLGPALHWLERALGVWRDSGDLLTEGRVRETLGITHTSRGALAEAEHELVTAMALFRRHGAQAQLAAIAPKRAYLRLLASEPQVALALCMERPEAPDSESNPYQRSARLAVLGVALAHLGRAEEARRSTRTASHHPFALVTALRCEAEAAIVTGDPAVAGEAASSLLDVTRR
jgi:tetratricopeptide (TPR) repeat protein